MRVRYTPRAARQLVDIFQYLHNRSPSGARNVLAQIRETEMLIGAFPLAGVETERVGTRRMLVPGYPYLIFYTISGGQAVIHRIRHAARRP